MDAALTRADAGNTDAMDLLGIADHGVTYFPADPYKALVGPVTTGTLQPSPPR